MLMADRRPSYQSIMDGQADGSQRKQKVQQLFTSLTQLFDVWAKYRCTADVTHHRYVLSAWGRGGGGIKREGGERRGETDRQRQRRGGGGVGTGRQSKIQTDRQTDRQRERGGGGRDRQTDRE